MNNLQATLTALIYSTALVLLVSVGAEPDSRVGQQTQLAESQEVVEWMYDEFLEPGICEML